MDVLYRDYGLIIELAGRLGHSGAGRFRDLERDNSATGDGLATLRYGSADVTASLRGGGSGRRQPSAARLAR